MSDRYALGLDRTNQLRVVRGSTYQTDPAEGEVLVETLFVAICGTDLEVIDGTSDRARPPVVLGHEWAGQTLDGEFVVGDNLVRPGCEIGFELPGGFASHFAIPAQNLRRLPGFLHGPAACLVEPLAVAVRACRQADLAPTHAVLVVGDGVIGMLIARVASLTAPRVTLVGKHEDRLRIAQGLGVPGAVRQNELEPGRWGVVFEASGKAAGLSAAIEVAAEGGLVVLAGDYGRDPAPTDATAIVRKELRLIGSNASGGAWDEAVRLASIRAVDLTVITPFVLPFARWPEALEAARSRRALRVVLRHPAADAKNEH